MTYTITLTPEELANQELHPNTRKLARHFFEVHGFLKIENLFPKNFIEELASSYEKELIFNQEEVSLQNGTQASHRRYIVPIPFIEPFNNPLLYANRILMPLMQDLLGPHFILNSLGAISALPGSTDQHLHADYYPLFEEDVLASSQTPPFAITFAVPLIDVDLLNGPTQIWAGSHKTYPIEKNMQAYPRHNLHGPVGSCYFWDYRTFHAGGSNHSDTIRSLLYLSYTRRWFKDSSNPDHLLISEEVLKTIPPEHLKLFSHLQKPQKK